jgi:hypothetical protein
MQVDGPCANRLHEHGVARAGVRRAEARERCRAGRRRRRRRRRRPRGVRAPPSARACACLRGPARRLRVWLSERPCVRRPRATSCLRRGRRQGQARARRRRRRLRGELLAAAVAGRPPRRPSSTRAQREPLRRSSPGRGAVPAETDARPGARRRRRACAAARQPTPGCPPGGPRVTACRPSCVCAAAVPVPRGAVVGRGGAQGCQPHHQARAEQGRVQEARVEERNFKRAQGRGRAHERRHRQLAD